MMTLKGIADINKPLVFASGYSRWVDFYRLMSHASGATIFN